MKKTLLFILFIFFACQQKPTLPIWHSYDESAQLKELAKNEDEMMRYKLIQSKNLDRNEIFKTIYEQLDNFNEKEYAALLPYILDKDILSIQKSIDEETLTYEMLTKWYLYRILKFESNKETFLNGILAINPTAVEEAKQRDSAKEKNKKHPIYGMPILLKDNINTKGMPTTEQWDVCVCVCVRACVCKS